MRLFDERNHYDEGSIAHREALYHYLSRSARPEIGCMRSTLEEWFSRYPAQAQAELCKRFRSGHVWDHRAAAFELCLHEVLLRLGCGIRVHPELTTATTHPEFDVEPPIGERFYLEAVLATGDSEEERAARSRVDDIITAFDHLESPDFWLIIDVMGSPQTSISTKRMRSSVRKRLAGLDPERIEEAYGCGDLDRVPVWTFKEGNCEIRIYPYPRPPHLRGQHDPHTVGGQGRQGPRLLAVARKVVRDKVVEKASKYGRIDRPYVIAVNVPDVSVDMEDVEQALLGEKISVQLRPRDSRIKTVVMRNGAWRQPGGPQCTRVSAVLAVVGLIPWEVARVEVRLYHNPYAQRPYSSVLTRLPQGFWVSDHVEARDGESLRSILGLPPDWPGEA